MIMAKKNTMTKEAVSRIYSATSKAKNGKIPKGSFGSRAKSALDKRGKSAS